MPATVTAARGATRPHAGGAQPACEVNFDALVGPTHNYGGLAHGNTASLRNRNISANPRAAALQGLAKMKLLADLGIPQAVLPPHERPAVSLLRACGFDGDDAAVLRAAARYEPGLLRACTSASAMWAASAATVTPSADTADGRVHLTPANLAGIFHRSLEASQTTRVLRAVFRDPACFVVHDPVPGGAALGDEGAANHTRFAAAHAGPGLHLFVYGHGNPRAKHASPPPQTLPLRQSRIASEAIARRHLLSPARVCFAQQNPAAIAAGAFHNDLVATAHEHVFLYHEHAFARPRPLVDLLKARFARLQRGAELVAIEAAAGHIPLADAIRSGLFNSQIVTTAPGRMTLLAPTECLRLPAARSFIEDLIAGGRTPIGSAHYLEFNQSMRNGGGPASQRLRVVLTAEELHALPRGVMLTAQTYAALVRWVHKHYRDHLAGRDLADPQLLEESRQALDELTQILGLGSIYSFQGA